MEPFSTFFFLLMFKNKLKKCCGFVADKDITACKNDECLKNALGCVVDGWRHMIKYGFQGASALDTLNKLSCLR